MVWVALAAVGGALFVQRAPEAIDCPDAGALAAAIARLTPKAPEPPAGSAEPAEDRFDVRFTRAASRYRVVVRARGTHAGTRTLDDPGATCASLAEATALAIAVIVDPEGVRLAEPPPSPVEPPAAAAPPPRPPAPESVEGAPPAPSDPEALGVAIHAGAGVTFGLVREIAPAAFVAVELRPAPVVSLEAGLSFVPTQSLALERGSVDVWLLAATTDACVWPWARSLRLGACVGIRAGTVHGEGKGYPVESGVSRSWLAFAATGAASGPVAGPLGWTLRASAVVPSHRESFGIEGLGVAYTAASVGADLAAGVTMTIW